MPPKRTNPARDEAAGLGTVVHLPATDTRVCSEAPHHLQSKWLARRFGLPEHRARLLADLAFQVSPRRA
jgi:hypothetical protein